MKFAIVGCQHAHLQMFIDEMLELGHEFAGIYDDSDYFLPALYAEKYGVPRLSTLDEVLAAGVSVIGNADRNDRKIDHIEWAERHGLHIMTDKPIAIDANGLERLRAVIARGRITIGMMLTERFEPSLNRLKRLIDDGELGELLDFTFLKPHKLNPSKRPAWFYDKAVNGGLIIDIEIHDVDTLKWLTGRKVVDYSGLLVKNTAPEYPGLYDNAQVQLLLEGGITATLKSDWLMPEASELWGDGRIFVTGTKGRAEIRSAGDPLGAPGPFITLTTHQHKTVRLEAPKPALTLSADFMQQIAGGAALLPAEDALACNELVVAIDAAARTLNRYG